MNSTIFDRLTKEAEKQRDEYKRRDEVKRQDEMKDATFTPKIPLSAVKRPSIGATSNNNSIFDRLNAEAVKLKQQKQALQMQQSGFSFGSSAPSSARKVAPSVHNTTSNTATASTTSNSNVASTPRKVVNPAPAVKPVPSQDNSGWITKKPIQVPPVITTTDATTVQVENSVQILQPLSEQPEASTQATVTSSDAVESVEKDNTAAVVDVSSAIPTASTAVELPTQSESVSEEDGPVIELDIEQLKLDMEGNAVGELDVNEVETF